MGLRLLDRLMGREDSSPVAAKAAEPESAKSHDVIVVPTPVEGEVVPLAEVPDPVFSKGMLGPGVAVRPSSGLVRAPLSGVVSAMFPTGHALGLSCDNGLELLIHIGLDTVELGGKHFEPLVVQGERVEAAQPLVSFDVTAVAEEGYNPIVPVLVSNGAEYASVIAQPAGEDAGERLLVVER